MKRPIQFRVLMNHDAREGVTYWTLSMVLEPFSSKPEMDSFLIVHSELIYALQSAVNEVNKMAGFDFNRLPQYTLREPHKEYEIPDHLNVQKSLWGNKGRTHRKRPGKGKKRS